MAADKNRLRISGISTMLADMRPTLFILLLMLLTRAATAAPEQRLNNVYYTVTGSTAEDLWTDVMTKSPVEHNGKKHVAYTRWQVNWQFWWHNHGSACEINKVKTRLDITYTLPRLEPASTMPDTVTARWEDYYAALFEHEQGHKDLGVQAANEVENRILAMGPRDSCAQLELDANTIGKQVIDRYSLIEKEYDRSTNHGLNTGAVFP